MKDHKYLQNSQKFAEALWKMSSKLTKMAETPQFFVETQGIFGKNLRKCCKNSSGGKISSKLKKIC